MKNIIFYFIIILITSSLLYSCGDTDDNENNEQISNDYNLLTVDDSGGIFNIGNNSGEITKIGQVNGIIHRISTNTITASQESIYSIEYTYNPSPINNLLVYNRLNHSTELVQLQIPNSIIGDEPGIIALNFNGSDLIGVLAENVLVDNSTKHLISIDIQSFVIDDLEITFNEDTITSLEQINNKLYLSTWGEGFLEVDLNNNSVNNLEFNPSIQAGSRLAYIDNSRIALMQAIPNHAGAGKPIELNLSDHSVIDKSKGNIYWLSAINGSSIYDNGIYLNLVSSTELDIYYGILKCNYETNEIEIVEINSNDLNRNMMIVDKTT